jgi:hypothetical protein
MKKVYPRAALARHRKKCAEFRLLLLDAVALGQTVGIDAGFDFLGA